MFFFPQNDQQSQRTVRGDGVNLLLMYIVIRYIHCAMLVSCNKPPILEQWKRAPKDKGIGRKLRNEATKSLVFSEVSFVDAD